MMRDNEGSWDKLSGSLRSCLIAGGKGVTRKNKADHRSFQSC
jgi:hypothetical protein